VAAGKEKSGKGGLIFIIILLLVLGGAGAAWYTGALKNIKFLEFIPPPPSNR